MCKKFCILITGGSQGADIFEQSWNLSVLRQLLQGDLEVRHELLELLFVDLLVLDTIFDLGALVEQVVLLRAQIGTFAAQREVEQRGVQDDENDVEGRIDSQPLVAGDLREPIDEDIEIHSALLQTFIRGTRDNQTRGDGEALESNPFLLGLIDGIEVDVSEVR